MKKKISLASQIFIALILAIIAGVLLGGRADFARSYIKPFGTVFLNLIKEALNKSARADSERF